MRSDICRIMNDGRREQALNEAEKFSKYCELSQKQTLHIRLLTEELTGILYGVAGTYEADFYLEKIGDKVSLHLVSAAKLKLEERKQLQEVASSGKNEAVKGIAGKIRNIFEEYLLNFEDVDHVRREQGFVDMGMLVTPDNNMNTCVWSLRQYKGNMEKEAQQQKEEWDELEKSIIANLADDVTVGINLSKVEIIVTVNVKE